MARMSRKQRIFVEEYLRCWNGAEAARRAGYKRPRNSAAENMAKPYIATAIRARIHEVAMDADEVLVRLAEQARGVPAECYEKYGRLVGVNFDRLQELDLMHLIKKISYDANGNPIVEFYNAQNALVQLGRALALFTDRREIAGELDVKVTHDFLLEDVQRRLSRLAAGDDAEPVSSKSNGRGVEGT